MVELSIILPTYNEHDNVAPMIKKLRAALDGLEWEVIYVDDDSPDGTADQVWKIAQKDQRVRCLKRVGRRGLSSAAIEGMLASSAPFLAVMDADMQHDEGILREMLHALKAPNAKDIVIGSRYVDGGGMDGWTKGRIAASQNATRFAQFMTGVKVKDPMSGFFMLRREFFSKCVHQLNGKGFKILLDILMSAQGEVKLQEYPYTFRTRQHGESKLNMKVVLDFFALVLDKTIKRYFGHFWELMTWILLAVGLTALIIMNSGYCPLW